MAARPPRVQECVEGYLFVPAPCALLLLRRPPERESAWVPVSGKLEPYDRDHAAALERELWEETGLRPDGPLLDLDWSVDFAGPDGGPWHLLAYGVPLDQRWVPRLSREHVAWEWVPADRAVKTLFFPDNRQAVGRLLERLAAAPALPRGPEPAPAVNA